VMNFNDDTTLRVLGQRSDNAQWESVTANWSCSPSLFTVVVPSTMSASLLLSPTDTASGWIRVSMGDDTRTKPDTVWVDFTRHEHSIGSPLRKSFSAFSMNPANGGISITTAREPVRVDVFSIKGGFVVSKAFGAHQSACWQFDNHGRRAMPKGAYLVRACAGDGVVGGKIVVVR
jgi:hypothetical protein